MYGTSKGRGNPASQNESQTRTKHVYLSRSMIIPSYMIHKSSMSSKKNTEIIMKASLQNKRDGLPPTVHR